LLLAFVMVHSSLSGHFALQTAADCVGVAITATFAYKNTLAPPTSGHQFHIHTDAPVQADACASAGGHFDPSKVFIHHL